jgi:hypothetical protein
MPAMRAWICAGLATLSLGAPAAFAGDERFKVEKDELVVSIDGNWQELDAAEISPLAAAYEIEGVMRWFFEPHPGVAKDLTNGDLRMLARDLRREIESQGSQASDEVTQLEGGDVSGYYVRGVNPKAGANELKYMYIGYVVVGRTIAVEFSILWSKGGEGSANRALAAVRGMRLGKN